MMDVPIILLEAVSIVSFSSSLTTELPTPPPLISRSSEMCRTGGGDGRGGGEGGHTRAVGGGGGELLHSSPMPHKPLTQSHGCGMFDP